MKPFTYLVILLSFLSSSCHPEIDTDLIQDAKSHYIFNDKASVAYKGIFTTNGSEYRAVLDIIIPKPYSSPVQTNDLLIPRAMVTLMNNDVITIYATNISEEPDGARAYSFTSDRMNFTLRTNAAGDIGEVLDANYQNISGTAIVAVHTIEAPVVAITGTYSCTTCNGHPNVTNGSTQTFNMMFSSNQGVGSITTQSVLGSTTYYGIGYQNACTLISGYNTCAIESGDGATTNVGHYAAGNPVTWTGTHESNFITVSIDGVCNEVYGTWQWPSNSYGLLSGTFQSDSTCP